jgi:flagellar motor protein MotB
MPETIGRQAASYRQGLVLGLTMAEIMLLLVFCMLIAVGAVLSAEQARLSDAMNRLEKTEAVAAAQKSMLDDIKRNPRLAEFLEHATGSAPQQEIDEFWRKLVESNDVVAGMERRGVSLETLRRETDAIAKLQRLLGEGIGPEKMARGIALASAVDETAAMKALPSLTPQQVVALIEKGLAASLPQTESRESGHTWPPIINLSEANGYYFATGSAELTPEFDLDLRTVVAARLIQIARSYDVDVIEVIGHTDEQPVTNRFSNLDRTLPLATLDGNRPGLLQWSDNAGLGLARALAVVKVLAADPRLRNFRILPLSAAQLIDTDGRLTHWDGRSDAPERRRIEIRMRKST